MKTLLILLLYAFNTNANAQLSSIIISGDTIYNVNPLTNTKTQLTKLGISASTQALLDTKAPLVSPVFTTPNIGVATGTSLALTGNVGYGAGSGGTITQLTSKSTAVILNKTSGQITMNAAALTAGSEAVFIVNNSTVAATDVPFVAIQSVGTAGSYQATVSSVAAGSFSITISNVSAGSLSQALVLNFVVFKGSNN